YKSFLRRLTGVLDKVALAKDRTTVEDDRLRTKSARRGQITLNAPVEPWRKASRAQALAGPDLSNFNKGWCIWILDQMDGQALATRWVCYVVDSDVSGTLAPLKGDLTLQTVLRDGSNESITEEDLSLSFSLGSLNDRSSLLTTQLSWLARTVNRSRSLG